MKTSPRREENMTLRALYLLAIVFVVDGHTTFADMFDLQHLFRYYSFHLMLFAFGSGYLFRDADADAPLAMIARKAKRLLVPLYAWNLVYGLGGAFLRRFGGFEIGAPVTLYRLVVAPLTNGEHFVWNLGSWFVFPLFLAQALYVLVRRAARLWGDREPVTFLVCLVPGAIAAQLCAANRQDLLPLFLLRTFILLPGYAGGVLYRRCLQKHDNLPTVPYLLGLVVLRVLVSSRFENLAYLLSSCTYMGCGAVGVYLGGAIAIAFWLRIARLLGPYVEKSRLALAISRHTFDIMMHHYMGFFAVNCLFLGLNALGIGAADFSVMAFRTQKGYMYAPVNHEEWNAIYVLAGLLLPLAIAWILAKMKTLFHQREAKKGSGD